MPPPSGERKIKYYKSTMTPGEVRQTPGKDAWAWKWSRSMKMRPPRHSFADHRDRPGDHPEHGHPHRRGDARAAAPDHSHGGRHRLQRNRTGGRDHQVQRLDRETLRGCHRPAGASRRSVVRDLFTRALQRPAGILARHRSREPMPPEQRLAQNQRAHQAEVFRHLRPSKSPNWSARGSPARPCASSRPWTALWSKKWWSRARWWTRA